MRRVRQSILGQMVTAGPCSRCGGVGPDHRAPVRRLPAARGAGSRSGPTRSTSPPASTPVTLRLSGAGRPGLRGGAAGRPLRALRVAPAPALRARGLRPRGRAAAGVDAGRPRRPPRLRDARRHRGPRRPAAPSRAGSGCGAAACRTSRAGPGRPARAGRRRHARRAQRARRSSCASWPRSAASDVAPPDKGFFSKIRSRVQVTGPASVRGRRPRLRRRPEAPALRTTRHHLERVLAPARPGDAVDRSRRAGPLAACAVRHRRSTPLGEVSTWPPAGTELTVALRPVKGERPEWRCRSSPSSASTASCRSWPTGRSCAGTTDGRAGNVERCARVAREAAMQCRAAVAARRRARSRPSPRSPARRGCGPGRPAAAPAVASTHPTVLVGPEGGWSDDERAVAAATVDASASTVLRAETAAIAAGVLARSRSVATQCVTRRAFTPTLMAPSVIRSATSLPYSPIRSWGGVSRDNGSCRMDDAGPHGYGRRVGERLRLDPPAEGPSLQDVEATSDRSSRRRCSAPTSGASGPSPVPRLQRLAPFYNVPVDQLLPRRRRSDRRSDLDRSRRRPAGDTSRSRSTCAAARARRRSRRRAADALPRMIQVQRQDFNGRMLTIRRDDLRAIACILDTPSTDAVDRSTTLGLALCRERGGRPASDPVRGLPPRPVLRPALRLLRVRHLDRPRPPGRRSTSPPAAATSRGPSPAAWPPATSVFFGGGTPSLVPPAALVVVLDAIPLAAGRRGHRRVQPRHGHRRAGRHLPRAAA